MVREYNQLCIRIPKAIHNRIKKEAFNEGMPLQTFVLAIFEREFDHLDRLREILETKHLEKVLRNGKES